MWKVKVGHFRWGRNRIWGIIACILWNSLAYIFYEANVFRNMQTSILCLTNLRPKCSVSLSRTWFCLVCSNSFGHPLDLASQTTILQSLIMPKNKGLLLTKASCLWPLASDLHWSVFGLVPTHLPPGLDRHFNMAIQGPRHNTCN